MEKVTYKCQEDFNLVFQQLHFILQLLWNAEKND